MTVRHVKHVSFYFFGPSHCITPTTGWTESVFTVMKYFSSVSTLRARVIVNSQCSSPASSYISNCFVLLGMNKRFWILAVNVPPLVKEISKAILFLTKPVMLFPGCMNSTFTHAAIVFDPILIVSPFMV
jgi:hypothetical protein